jgi:hypothetical protein
MGVIVFNDQLVQNEYFDLQSTQYGYQLQNKINQFAFYGGNSNSESFVQL